MIRPLIFALAATALGLAGTAQAAPANGDGAAVVTVKTDRGGVNPRLAAILAGIEASGD